MYGDVQRPSTTFQDITSETNTVSIQHHQLSIISMIQQHWNNRDSSNNNNSLSNIEPGVTTATAPTMKGSVAANAGGQAATAPITKCQIGACSNCIVIWWPWLGFVPPY